MRGVQVRADEDNVPVLEAMRMAGAEDADYIRIRTRAEIAWLQLVSEWFDQEARRLDAELRSAG